MTKKPIRYQRDNNEKRLTMVGRECIILAWGTLESILIEFIDNGQKEVVSYRAVY